jgi:hypothetical protein
MNSSSTSSLMIGSNENVSKTTPTKTATRVQKGKNKLTVPEDEKMNVDRDATPEAQIAHDPFDEDDDNEQTVKPSALKQRASRRRNATTASTRRQTTATSGVRASGSTMTKKRGTPLPDKVKVLLLLFVFTF